MMSDEQRATCPQCGAELGEQQLAGLCPKCLMRKGLGSMDSSTLPVDPDGCTGEAERVVAEVPGRYTLIGEHARGGMGRVLVVHDESLGRDVALKELLPGSDDDAGVTPTPARHSKELTARFLREAKVTGQLEHPGITPVHELGRRPDGSLYYTMKLVRGRTLDKAIRAAESYEQRRYLLQHFVGLCQAISYAHSRGVIHRDLKPSNIMIGEFGETVVVDWGLAKVIEGNGDALAEVDPDVETVLLGSEPDSERFATETEYGEVMGTPAYMSPEQSRGQLDKIDERSDVYSLGAVLYQILAGVAPFQGKSVEEIVDKAMHEVPTALRDVERRVSRELASICEHAMARDRDERTASAGVLARQVERAAGTPDVYPNPLRPFLSDLVPELRGVTRLEKTLVVSEANRRWRRKNRWPSILQDLAVVGAITLYAAIALVAFFALIALARELGLALGDQPIGHVGWDEAIWIAVTVGFLLPFVLTTRAHNRSIAPYVREVLFDREALASSTGRSRLVGAARKIAGMGLAGTMAGTYVSILLMSEVTSSPSITPILLGVGVAVVVESYLLWRSERRQGRTEKRAVPVRP